MNSEMSNLFYSEILNSMTEGFVVQDQTGKIIFFNHAACVLLGLSEDQLLGRTSMDPRWQSIHEDGTAFPGTEHPSMYTIRTGLPQQNIVMGVRSVDARTRWLKVSSLPFKNDFMGQESAVLATFSDISRQMEKARLISGIVSNSPGMLYQFKQSPDGTQSFPFVSPKAQEIYEITAEELILDPDLLMSLIYEEDRAGLYKATQESTKSLKPFHWRGRILTKKGKLKWVQIDGVPREDSDGGVISDGILVDITKEIETQKELAFQREKAAHSSKLASLGRMSGGIAHEINNPLTIISGMSKLLVLTANDPIKLADRVQKIGNAVERIANIVNGLRRFSRSDDKIVRDQCELKSILNEVINATLAKVHKGNVHLTVHGHLDSKIICDQAEIEQVLENLVENAVDAIQNLAEKWIKIEVKADQEKVVLQIIDSGTGIPDEISNKLFDPFFTTKEVGEGTGLGLSMSRGIIKDHGGELRIAAGPNTCFEVELPLYKSEIK